ncbi:phage head-tail joining protein [Azospirillum doebereinerae]|uniref:phage head-tail joining protein n=1 Tax=Azospirillum doebereinerae TaxID=92933 RepID=UPI001EE56315|nr:hypothetical protein [Azospirillum doebereinerae]MCG5241876.1 hypothetical protein [Azospirillum doebereinerae]
MAYTQTQLDALDAAIASGALRVTYDGKTVEYRSTADLIRARALVLAELGRQTGDAPSGRRFASFRSGLR